MNYVFKRILKVITFFGFRKQLVYFQSHFFLLLRPISGVNQYKKLYLITIPKGYRIYGILNVGVIHCLNFCMDIIIDPALSFM
jgi:hypothetical protein